MTQTTAEREQLIADLKEVAGAYMPIPYAARDVIWKAAETIAADAASPGSETDKNSLVQERGSLVDSTSRSNGCVKDQFDFESFERATELMAMWLARFRDEAAEVTDNDRLTAGHLAGVLAANNLLVRTQARVMTYKDVVSTNQG